MPNATLESPLEGAALSETAQQEMLQIVSFRIASEEYGVDIMHVQEIILMGQITEMPQVPGDMRGLINLRGHVIPIVDLRTRFGFSSAGETEETRVVVLNVAKRTMGIVVDAVNEVLRVEQRQVEPTTSGFSGANNDYVSGLLKLENRLLILLNIHAIAKGETMTDVSAVQDSETG